MKRTIASRIHAAASAVTECVLYILTGAGLLYVPAVCITLLSVAMRPLIGEPFLLESMVLCIGAAGCAGAALLSFLRLRNKFWSWPIFLLLTLLTAATGLQTLHAANEVIEVSFGQLQFYPAVLLPFHLLWNLLPPTDQKHLAIGAALSALFCCAARCSVIVIQ